MDMARLGAVAIIATLLILLLKGRSPVFAVITALSATAVMAYHTIPALEEILQSFTALFENSGIEPSYSKSVIKVIGIAYFTEITSALCRDAGETAIAQKFDLAGRMAVLIFTIPAVSELMTVIIEALNLI